MSGWPGTLYEEEMRLRIELCTCELRHGGQRARGRKEKLRVRVAVFRVVAVSDKYSGSEGLEE